MASLIDTSVLVDVERGRVDFGALLEAQGDGEVAMAAITAAELLHGVHRLRTSKRKARAEALVETLLASIPVIPFDLVCARALARGFSVVTRDRRSFRRIPGLEVVDLT